MYYNTIVHYAVQYYILYVARDMYIHMHMYMLDRSSQLLTVKTHVLCRSHSPCQLLKSGGHLKIGGAKERGVWDHVSH